MSQTVICATCQRALDIHTSSDGVRYLHTAQDPADHPAVPMDAPPGWTGGRCDFCSVDHPRFELPARDFAVGAAPGLPVEQTRWHYSRGAWAACDMCALLVQADRWTELARRAVAGFEKRHGCTLSEPARTAIRALHRKLRQHISGSLKPIGEGGN